MHHISKSAIVPYSCEQMFQLVNQIERYPEFLNWCASADILMQSEAQIIASVGINKGAFNQSFTTINTLNPNTRIDMSLKEGPFKHLKGAWIFKSLTQNACKITLELEFSFASKVLDLAISPVFTAISNAQLDAFTQRAKQIYG